MIVIRQANSLRVQWYDYSGLNWVILRSIKESVNQFKILVDRGTHERVEIMQGNDVLVYWEKS